MGHDGSNAGRPPDWLKEKCRKLIEQKDLVGFLARVAAGDSEDMRVVFDDNNVPHKEKCAAAIKDRLHAAEILLDRGFGKPSQSLDVEVSKSKEDREAKEKRFGRLYGYIGAAIQ